MTTTRQILMVSSFLFLGCWPTEDEDTETTFPPPITTAASLSSGGDTTEGSTSGSTTSDTTSVETTTGEASTSGEESTSTSEGSTTTAGTSTTGTVNTTGIEDTCGDGEVDTDFIDEQCDGDDFFSNHWETLNCATFYVGNEKKFYPTTPFKEWECTDTCEIVLDGCKWCGDGIISFGDPEIYDKFQEECDINAQNASCMDYGYSTDVEVGCKAVDIEHKGFLIPHCEIDFTPCE